MRRFYKDIDSVKKSYLIHSIALRCKILTPLPYVKMVGNRYSKEFGSFSENEIKKIGNLSTAMEDNNSFFLRPNTVRYLLYAITMGIDKPFKSIYWHDEFSEYVFVDFDNPFKGNKYNKYLNEVSDELIISELAVIEKAIHCSKSISLFREYGFSDKIKDILENIEAIRECTNVGSLQ